MAGQKNKTTVEEQPVIGPASPFQEKYLNSDAQIILVGGAAGSSKSCNGRIYAFVSRHGMGVSTRCG